MKGFLLLLLFVINPDSVCLHDFHLSKCIVEYDEEKEMIQISMQLFIDDLESALSQLGANDLFIGTEKEHEDTDDYISQYINQGFQIEIDETAMDSLSYIGKEVSEDLASVWCYLEILEISEIDQLYIKNGILQETFSDQKNIVKIIGPNNQISHFLSQIGNNEKSMVYKDE